MSGQAQVAIDVCLQCGKCREQVRDYFDSPCATATYGEYVEGLDDWLRHHWRDWSDADLAKYGLPESWWNTNRRTDYYDLEFAWREATCQEQGHAPDYEGYCPRCYVPTSPDMRGAE